MSSHDGLEFAKRDDNNVIFDHCLLCHGDGDGGDCLPVQQHTQHHTSRKSQRSMACTRLQWPGMEHIAYSNCAEANEWLQNLSWCLVYSTLIEGVK